MSNTVWVLEFFGCFLVSAAVGVLFASQIVKNLRAAENLKAAEQTRGPERRIIFRWPVEDGEIAKLECGHQIHLIVHRREYLNCKECASVPADGAGPAHSVSPEATKK